MLKPNFKNNLVNISSTFENYLGGENQIPTLPFLNSILKEHKYKNVVFMIFDGMGVKVLKDNLKNDDYLLQHMAQKVTSTFPATTTNATTTLATAMYPNDHLWLGWSVFIKELNAPVLLYLNKNEKTNEDIAKEEIEKYHTLPTAYYKRIEKPNRKIYSIFPNYVEDELRLNTSIANDENELFVELKKILSNNEEKFVYCYCDNPDHNMHRLGTNNDNIKNILNTISMNLKEIESTFDDTLIVITADHGHIDVEEIINIYEDKELLNILERPLSLEPRAMSLKIKQDCDKRLKEVFKKYKKDFKLVKVDKLIKQNFFGGTSERLKEILGDYIVIGKKTNKILSFYDFKPQFKGHHTGLTKVELEVPLIIIGNKNGK